MYKQSVPGHTRLVHEIQNHARDSELCHPTTRGLKVTWVTLGMSLWPLEEVGCILIHQSRCILHNEI